MSDKECAATPVATLRDHIMDSRVSKSEAEHWAARRIAELEELLRRTLPHIGSNRISSYDDEKRLRADIEAALAESN